MAVPLSSSIAAEASRATELKVPKPPSTISEQSQAEIEPVCPLHGADYDSIIHFGREITTLRLRKEYFEEADQGIVEYSKLLTTENDKLDVVLSEKMVNHLYTIQVLALWSFDSPVAEKMLSQVSCSHEKAPERLDL